MRRLNGFGVKRVGVVILVAIMALLTAGCSNVGSASAATNGNVPTKVTNRSVLTKGIATFALQPDNYPDYIFPLVSSEYFTLVNEDEFEYLSYRPLFWFGKDGTTSFNAAESLAYYPRFSINKSGHTVVTVTLKPWKWSNGQPITTRDVEFWMNLLEADRSDWGVYVPGAFPDNVTAVKYLSPTQFQMSFNKDYNHEWLVANEMTQIFPIPQRIWDKTSASSPVGNYDLTPKGAAAVYKFLNQQSHDVAAYGRNPLWKVVDGPWILKSYVTTTGQATFIRNSRYEGPRDGDVKTFQEVPFTSDTAEFDALRSGELDVGYIPRSDISEISYLKTHGYRISAWWAWNFNYITLDLANRSVKSELDQVYLRQDMERLINQKEIIADIYHGFAKPTFGVIPSTVRSPYLTSAALHNPFPFDPSAAAHSLAAHGWAVKRDGATTCRRPGTGVGRCGAGIGLGETLAFSLLYPSGSVSTDTLMEDLRTEFLDVGIDLTLHEEPFDQVTSTVYSCDPSTGAGCAWELGADQGWEYYAYPSGEQLFKGGGSGNSDDYNNPIVDSLIEKTLTSPGLEPMFRYENYIQRQVPVLYIPTPAYQITAYKTGISGVTPQDPDLNVYPELWRSGKG